MKEIPEKSFLEFQLENFLIPNVTDRNQCSVSIKPTSARSSDDMVGAQDEETSAPLEELSSHHTKRTDDLFSLLNEKAEEQKKQLNCKDFCFIEKITTTTELLQ